MTERQHQANRLLRDGDYKSIRDMLGRIKDQLPKSPILAELDDKKEIKYWNSEDLYEEVMSLGDGLLDAGLGGKHIAIVSENCVRYVIADICISSGVGVVTPIDVNAPAPLLTMLNSCAEGMSVVNIDNGFGAGYLAARINTLIETGHPS